ncbi:uncharacterized protein [Setaria viridis]|uniref:Tyrosine-specific transport protein n=1 Tax=Setaria viridis TaxID=4556 RepID=A0A4U6W1Q4_SETVI|nr:tyrosine-specific transport protein-like isoform X4 [Setaria viridis]TKW36338.1 hypothetical protein SEVIR_2G434100v2 [Setaria viridis]
MALISAHCYPLLKPSLLTTPSSVSARTPVLRRVVRRGTRRPLQRCLCSQYADERQPPESPQQLERLFSNLNQATMKHEPGSVTSAIFLVAGTTVGAGILAIPAVTQEAGFLASAVTCIFCWLYMVVTGLLVAEVNVNTMCEIGSGGVSLLILFIYTLCTSCRIRGTLFRYHNKLIGWESATLFSLAFGGICYFGSQRLIGAVNGFLVVASGNLQWSSLLEANFAAAPQSIPIIALSFVYQNVVPVLCTNLEGNLSKVRTAIVAGTAIPLALFLVWDGVILGTLPGIAGNSNVSDPLELLRSSNGTVGPIVEAFSFLAIGTSYIGFILGLSDFLADLLKLPSGQNKPLPFLLTLLPPLVLSLLDPEIFFKALDFAGTYGVLVLFGVFPAAMSWSERYSDELEAPVPPIVPGGKFTLGVVMGGALLVIVSEIVKDIMQLQGLH